VEANLRKEGAEESPPEKLRQKWPTQKKKRKEKDACNEDEEREFASSESRTANPQENFSLGMRRKF
jgi:hypothetical protein